MQCAVNKYSAAVEIYKLRGTRKVADFAPRTARESATASWWPVSTHQPLLPSLRTPHSHGITSFKDLLLPSLRTPHSHGVTSFKDLQIKVTWGTLASSLKLSVALPPNLPVVMVRRARVSWSHTDQEGVVSTRSLEVTPASPASCRLQMSCPRHQCSP